MKKVVRLSESNLNRLVKRIISEAPFDMDNLEKITPDDSDDELTRKLSDFGSKRLKYTEFEKSDVYKLLYDMEMLLTIAKDYCNNHTYDEVGQPHQYCSAIKYIESNMVKFHSERHSKRKQFQPQPIYPKRPKIG